MYVSVSVILRRKTHTVAVVQRMAWHMDMAIKVDYDESKEKSLKLGWQQWREYSTS